MSVATEFPPEISIPERARAPRAPERLASVTTLYRPSERTVSAPVRLTRRGVVVLGLAVAVLSAALLLLAWLSAPPAAAPHPASAVPDTVLVGPGDSLWTIAARIAPQRDPRAEVATLQRLNHLSGAALMPGQQLRTR